MQFLYLPDIYIIRSLAGFSALFSLQSYTFSAKMNVANYQFSRKFRENGSDQAKMFWIMKKGV